MWPAALLMAVLVLGWLTPTEPRELARPAPGELSMAGEEGHRTTEDRTGQGLLKGWRGTEGEQASLWK